MIEHNYRTKMNIPREKVFETLRDNQKELNSKLPNIVGMEVVERDCCGDSVVKLKADVRGRAYVPLFLKNAISQDLLRWYSHQTWDSSRYVCEYRIEALHFRKNVDISGHWKFEEDRAGSTVILIKSRICVDASGVKGIPGGLTKPAGLLAERVMHSLTGPSLTRVFREVEIMAGNGHTVKP